MQEKKRLINKPVPKENKRTQDQLLAIEPRPLHYKRHTTGPAGLGDEKKTNRTQYSAVTPNSGLDTYPSKHNPLAHWYDARVVS